MQKALMIGEAVFSSEEFPAHWTSITETFVFATKVPLQSTPISERHRTASVSTNEHRASAYKSPKHVSGVSSK